ncbi:MAG: acyl-CoA dehydrogenase family protein [Planctomycetes bacterium]|nr:acyl-CoA dehydrogenase family protein [Planctomycetota bacterium]
MTPELVGLAAEARGLVLETLQRLLERDLPQERQLALDESEEFPLELMRKMLSPEVGLHLVFLPEEAGGLGGGARDVCELSERMAAVDLGVATAFLSIALGTDPILVAGTEEQRRHWLGRIAEEGLIVAYGVTEPEAGSNVAALKTTAARIPGANGQVAGYRLNGAKQFITNGGVADLYTILAATPDGPSFFVVERGARGLSAGKKEKKHGIRASDTAAVLLEDVEVPAANLMGGEEGLGLRQANKVFGYTRLMVGALGLGGGQGALDRALAYARTRIQFGTPLIEKEGYMFKLIVPHWIDLAAARAYVQEIAGRIDAGEGDLQIEGSIAKLWATEAGNRAADAAMQALGGYGYAREYLVEKYRRDVRITTIYEGTSEIQQNIIGVYRWKAVVRSRGDVYEEAAVRLLELESEHPDCGAGLAAAALSAVKETILHCHETKTTRHQIVLFTLADLAAKSEVAAAFCRKAARLAQAGALEAPFFAAMSRVFAKQALAAARVGSRLCATGFARAEDAAEEAAAESEQAAESGLWQDMEIVANALRALS